MCLNEVLIMDLSTYYKDFQTTYNLSVFVLCLAAFVVIFIGIRSIMDKKESIKIKIINILLLTLLFVSILTFFLLGPALAKKDIEENTIYYYEGVLEILEISHGIQDKVTFSFNEQKITLTYSENEINCDLLKIGKYQGKLLYAQHLAHVLYLDIN